MKNQVQESKLRNKFISGGTFKLGFELDSCIFQVLF